MKIQFITDYFISPITCVEQGTIAELTDFGECFEIKTESGKIIGRYENSIKEELKKYFIELKEA